MFVDKKKIWPGVISHRDVRPPVVVEIRQHHSHALSLWLADSGSIARVGEGPIVIVVIQLDALAFVVPRVTVGAISRAPFAAPEIILRTPVDVVGDNEIQPAVLIVIEPPGASGPAAFIDNTGFCGDGGEGAGPVIGIKNGAAVASHV